MTAPETEHRSEKDGSPSPSGDDRDEDADRDDAEDAEDESEEVRAQREAQMHARFLRAVQELDFLGFVKHTGRRAEHIQKTVFEPPEM